jgi:hypothetical protein
MKTRKILFLANMFIIKTFQSLPTEYFSSFHASLINFHSGQTLWWFVETSCHEHSRSIFLFPHFFLNIECFACVLKFLCEQFYYRLNNKIDSTAEYIYLLSSCVIIYMYMLIKLCSRYKIFVLYLNIYT